MSYSTLEIWALIAVMGLGTFVIRFSFLGLIGDRALSPLALRLLRYTPVALIPGLVAPLVFRLDETGAMEPARLAAAAVTLAVGWRFKSMLASFAAGLATYYALAYVSSGISI